LTVALSLAVAVAPFFTNFEFRTVALIAVAWLLIVIVAFVRFGRIAYWLLIGAPIIGLSLLGSVLFGPRHPPPIIASVLPPDGSPDRVSGKISRIFADAFPLGSDEAKMVSTLRKQGFEFPLQPSNDCVPEGHPLPKVIPKTGIEICPKEDTSRALFVGWGTGPACNWVLWVNWKANSHGKIMAIKTRNYFVCL